MTGFLFLAAVLGTSAVLGLPVAVHPTLGQLSIPAKVALAWTTGSLILTFILTSLSAIGVQWALWWILPVCAAALALSTRTIQRNQAARPGPSDSPRFNFPFGSLCFTLIAGAGLYAFTFGVATSADLSYFWGVKAAHFAIEQGIDFELLRQAYMIHLHPNYPPLWPVLLAWGAMIARTIPWLAVPSLTWVCLTSAAAIIFSVLETRFGVRAATAVTCLWYAVLSTMMVTSCSGGNADGPLVLFLSVALVVILTEADDEPPKLRWLCAVALAGAVFTKSEGAVAASLIVAGTAVRDLIWRRPTVLRQTVVLIAPASVTAVLWFLVRMAHDLPLTDPIRETVFHFSFDHIRLIMHVNIRILTTGVVVVGWLVPLVTIFIVGRRRLVRALPGVVTSLGILVFATTYYLHAVGDPFQLILWTFPRLIQPAMSAWILGFGVAGFSVAGRCGPGAVLAEETIR